MEVEVRSTTVLWKSQISRIQTFSSMWCGVWLGEPGGPYKQYVIANERAQQMMSDAKSLYENHEFSRAKQKLEDAVNLFTQSNDIYPNAEGRQGIEEAESYIEKCETGMKADTAFAKATELFNQRKLEDAIKEFGDAQSLYEEIGYTAQVEACTLKIEESRILVGVQEEALPCLIKHRTPKRQHPAHSVQQAMKRPNHCLSNLNQSGNNTTTQNKWHDVKNRLYTVKMRLPPLRKPEQ